MPRDLLPERRRSETFSTSFAGETYDVTQGFYADGRTGEIFINRVRDKSAAKLGTHLDGVCRDGAILLSLALQHGTAIETIRHAVTRDENGEPSTIMGAIVDRIAGGK